MLNNRNRVIDYIRLLSKYPPEAEVVIPYVPAGPTLPDVSVPTVMVRNGGLTLLGNWRAEVATQNTFHVELPISPDDNFVIAAAKTRAKCVEWLMGMGLAVDEDYEVAENFLYGAIDFYFREEHYSVLFKLAFR
jgi:hypothetical protein